jgi:hypothetical protein
MAIGASKKERRMTQKVGIAPPIQSSSPETSQATLITLRAAAEQLGLPYFKLQRAAKAGLIPTYRLYNSRALVRLSEVVAVIEASRKGGAE